MSDIPIDKTNLELYVKDLKSELTEWKEYCRRKDGENIELKKKLSEARELIDAAEKVLSRIPGQTNYILWSDIIDTISKIRAWREKK